jgi:hypothetical protein
MMKLKKKFEKNDRNIESINLIWFCIELVEIDHVQNAKIQMSKCYQRTHFLGVPRHAKSNGVVRFFLRRVATEIAIFRVFRVLL